MPRNHWPGFGAPGRRRAEGSVGGLSRARKEKRSAISWGVSWDSTSSGMREMGAVFISSTWSRGMVSVLPPWILRTTRSGASSARRPVRTAAVVGGDGGGLVAGADDEVGVEDVGDELVEVVAAVAGDVGADLLAFSVNLVALGAELAEDFLTVDRVAGGFLEEVAHLDDDQLTLLVATLADGAEEVFRAFDEGLVGAALEASEAVDADGGGGDGFGFDGVEKGLAPDGALGEKLDDAGFQGRVEVGVGPEQDLSNAGRVEAAKRLDDPASKIDGLGFVRENLRDDIEGRRISRGDQKGERLQASVGVEVASMRTADASGRAPSHRPRRRRGRRSRR